MANAISKALKGVGSALAVILPKGRPNPAGTLVSPTFNPSNINNVLAAPAYRDHLTDIFTERTALDSRALIKQLLVNDPDMSATLNAFLTVADTEPRMWVKDPTGHIDPAGQVTLMNLLLNLTTRMDYTLQGFKIVQSLNYITESFRYMILAQGMIGSELILNKEFWPVEMRVADMTKIQWFEKLPGQFTPRQVSLTGQFIDLDIPTFFCTRYRQDPTTIYPISPFVSAINTIAARQQVINDLYRIMKITGYPRMDIKVMEEVLLKNAPPDAMLTTESKTQYVNSQLASITNFVSNLRPEQAFVHTDSVEAGVANKTNPGMSLDITSVITTLNGQNQAGLRVMSTIIGRGESGVNTASAETRLFSMNADGINKPIADMLSQMFTLALRMTGSQSRVEVSFKPVELRSDLELEPQLTMRASRLKEDLSLGIITDEEYHMQMYNRLPPEGSTPLMGTGFASMVSGANDPSSAITNNDPANSAVVSPDSKSAKGNAVKSGSPAKKKV